VAVVLYVNLHRRRADGAGRVQVLVNVGHHPARRLDLRHRAGDGRCSRSSTDFSNARRFVVLGADVGLAGGQRVLLTAFVLVERRSGPSAAALHIRPRPAARRQYRGELCWPSPGCSGVPVPDLHNAGQLGFSPIGTGLRSCDET